MRAFHSRATSARNRLATACTSISLPGAGIFTRTAARGGGGTRGRDGTAGLMYGMHAWVCMAALGLHGGVGFHCEGFSDGDVSFMAQMAISYGLSRDTGTCLNIPGVR